MLVEATALIGAAPRARRNRQSVSIPVPDCCRTLSSRRSSDRVTAIALAFGLAAQAVMGPPAGAQSFDDYMAEAYHRINGCGQQTPIDPAVFAFQRALILTVAREQQQADQRQGKRRVEIPAAPPPAPPVSPCCGGTGLLFTVRRRHRDLTLA